VLTDERIVGFDPQFGWQPARYFILLTDKLMLLSYVSVCSVCLLHKNVDTTKNVGFSSAASFARTYLDLVHAVDVDRHTIGLVPMAVGSTAIAEWRPDYTALSTSVDGTMQPQANASYHPDALNLFTCAMRTLYLAMKQLSVLHGRNNETRIAGLIWYQGENDTSVPPTAIAAMYSEQLRRFMQCFGRCSQLLLELLTETSSATQPPLTASVPVVVVAVTTTRPWLCKPPKGQLNHIRQQQLEFSASSRAICGTDDWGLLDPKRIAVLDAFGLPLRADGVHLTTVGYIRLGIEYAHALRDLRRGAPLAGSISSRANEAALQANLHSHARLKNECVHALNNSSIDEVITFIRERCTNITADLDVVSGKNAKQNALSTGLNATNFVYGEVAVVDLVSLFALAMMAPPTLDGLATGKEVASLFVSLGCGCGPCVSAAMISGLFTAVLGIEIMRYKAIECCLVASKLKTSLVLSETQAPSAVRIVEGNFCAVSWQSAADCVYSCATCYAPDQLKQLFHDCLQLKKGAKIVLIDSQILLDRELVSEYEEQERQLIGVEVAVTAPFDLIASKQCVASWGPCCGYVYVKSV
jgi:hypothetical protein